METGTNFKWYHKKWVLWALLLLMPYVGIPFMWITKKDYSMKKKLILTVIFGAITIAVFNQMFTESNTDNGGTAVSKNEQVAKEVEKKEEAKEEPNIPLSNDFEKAVWKIVRENKGELVSIKSDKKEGADNSLVAAAVLCENNEEVVNTIIDSIKEVITSNDTNEGILITFGDMKKDEDAPALLAAAIENDGTNKISVLSMDYKSKRNKWINDQFSAWDGSHKSVKELILTQLNDESSYKHIETKYYNINTEEMKEKINGFLSDAGYSERVEMDDLLISTEFSAKNAFGGRIKNTGYAIASYNENSITLIGIE